jgi:cell fate regulator YaaT (PSP1 superfamily)
MSEQQETEMSQPSNTSILLASVRFQPAGKTYHFSAPHALNVQPDDWVVIDTVYGLQVGQVAEVEPTSPGYIESNDVKPVLRIATGLDMARYQAMQKRAERIQEIAHEEIQGLNLDAKVITAELTLDGKNALVLCGGNISTTERKSLRRRLASRTSCRVELRNIGPRDQAKALGGYGVCGEERCCSRFLTQFQAVSIRMAKDQSISMAPSDITGMCGRLRCCLAYEHEIYKEASVGFPKRKSWVQTPKGLGRIIDWDILKEQVVVEIPPDGPRDERQRHRFLVDEVKVVPKGR